MKSNASGSSSYRLLAQQRARVSTELGLASLQRFADICEAVKGIAADMSFDHDAQTRIKVSGRVHCDARLACHRCEQLVWCHVNSDFASVIAFDEEQATSWSQLDPNLDILVVSGANLDVAELVEDELLLALPERVCTDDDCVHVPEMRYCEIPVDNVVDQVSMEGQKRFPFAGLKEAMQAGKKEQD